MGKRIFMDVSQVFAIADKLSNYSDTQTSMIDKYHLTAMKMIDSMEGASKNSLETAANHIKAETCDAIGRMTGFNLIYKITGNNRLLIDKEGAEAAKLDDNGIVIPRITVENNGEQYDNVDSKKTFTFYISSQEIFKITVDFGLSLDEVIQILKGFHPQNVSNDTVIAIIDMFTKKGSISQSTIDEHKKDNVEEIDMVYVSGEYIENQEYWGAIKYGDYNMAYNGCGIIAIINAYHSLGIDLTDEEVAELIAEFEYYGCVNNGAWGTSVMAIADYYREYTEYEVRCTTSADSDDLEIIDKNSDTFIVEVYNDGNSIYGGMHFVNIEKIKDENGDVKYIVHNADCYEDDNGNGHKDKKEALVEFDSLKEAIENVGSKDNSEYIMVIGLKDPNKNDLKINEEDSINTDAPEKEEKTC
ncbi:MAG: hypothetical protein K6G87_03660 [Butyrivibrio sp.]|uniref:hypothetical protein n=1 Tax=Butyrivibrio sp. TaxID=28121 RepID=UPI0025E071B0|nr:hypothetical protein [Butyrivibrio sp.]MCR5770315.1 hypothetical protein [Butyrivibrio sp.]